RPGFLDAIEINGQHVADGRALIFAFLESVNAAEHEKTAAAFGHELLQQRRLVGRKELRLQIVHDHRVIAIEVFGRARKSGSQLEFIARVKPDEHWLIITLDLVGRLVPETAIKRIAGLAGAAKEIEFRFAPGDADQPDEL